ISGAGGYICRPMTVSPLPSFEWQMAQWSAQWARASASTSLEFGIGLRFSHAPAGSAARRAVSARYSSKLGRLGASAESVSAGLQQNEPSGGSKQHDCDRSADEPT